MARNNPNWKIPREDVISVAVTAVTKWGYGLDGVVESMVRDHYQGVSPGLAAVKLRPEVETGVAAVIRQKYEEEAAALRQMEQELEAEGWRFIWAASGCGGFWMHASGWNVNRMGGCFSSKAQATRVTYASATRQLKVVRHWNTLEEEEGEHDGTRNSALV